MPRYRDEGGNWHQDRRRSQRQPGEYRQSWGVAACLWGGPSTPDGIADHFRSYLRWMGLFSITGAGRECLCRSARRDLVGWPAAGAWVEDDG
jgi:hypothetical protein